MSEQQQPPLANTVVIQWLRGYISPLLSGSFRSIGGNGEERHHKEAESLKTISYYGMCYEGSKTKRGNKTETLECLELGGQDQAARKGTFHGAKEQGKVCVNNLWMVCRKLKFRVRQGSDWFHLNNKRNLICNIHILYVSKSKAPEIN